MHLAFAYADHIGSGLGLPRPTGHLSQSAVALFFVVSGYIMVFSSGRLFATRDGSRIFWIRRCVRILPPYWLATLLLMAIMVYLGRPVDGEWLATSLALLPTATDAFQGRPDFLLWPGWTLFYEMAFYFLFGLGLRWGRLPAIVLASGAIVALVLAGSFIDGGNAFLISLTRPVLLIFLFGMALAAFRGRGLSLPAPSRFLVFALAVIAYFALPRTPADMALDAGYTLWAGLPAVLLAIAVLGGPLDVPRALLVNTLGDASYALYLLHVPLGMGAISFFPLRLGAWPFLLVTIVGVYAASLIAFVYVERPVTRWLNARLLHRSKRDAMLQETGV